MNLPICSQKDRILDSIDSKRVSIVVGSTGSGKSTLVPAWLSQRPCERCRILCVQPRRVAAIALAHRVSSLLEDPIVGQTVGYRMRGEVRDSASTRVVYTTAGYLRTVLSCEPSFLDHVTHILLDEVHERSMDADFLSFIVRQLLSAVGRNSAIKLVVMSATIDTAMFETYFSCLCPCIGIIEVPSSSPFSIETEYLEDIVDPSQLSDLLGEPDQSAELKDSLVDLIVHTALQRGVDGFTTLIFLPGEGAIEAIEKRLLDRIPSDQFRDTDDSQDPHEGSTYYEVHVLHSLVPIEEQRRALTRPKTSLGRHIVLATNVAESSLTVEAVNLVIDSGLRRISVYDSVRKIHSLKTTWTSKASICQRKGRTGRVCCGTVVRMFTRQIESLTMNAFDQPETLLANPAMVFLSAKFLTTRWMKSFPAMHALARLTPSDVLTGLVSFPASSFNLPATVADLHASGILKSEAENSDLTLFGSLAVWLQLDPCVAKLVFLSLLFQCPIEGIVLAGAAAHEKDVFKFSSKISPWREEKFAHRVFSSIQHRTVYDGGFASDLIMMRNLLVSSLVHRARYAVTDGPRICVGKFFTGGIFLSELEAFRSSCCLIAKSLSDWLLFISGDKHESQKYEEDSKFLSRKNIDDIFDSLEDSVAQDSGTVTEWGSALVKLVDSFVSVIGARRTTWFTDSDLSKFFLPLKRYEEADVLKLMLVLAFGAHGQRVLSANASFPRCDGEAVAVKRPGDADAGDIVKILTAGIEPVQVRNQDKRVSLVLSGFVENEREMAPPDSSEYACVTTSVGLRILLSAFEKVYRIDIGVDDVVHKLSKPYVYNVVRWMLPADGFGSPEMRVYLSPRNPSGWLETSSGFFVATPRVDGDVTAEDSAAVREDRNSDGRRKRLASTYFAIPTRVQAGSAVPNSLRAEGVTVLPIRCGGRVAASMLLCAVPVSEGSVRNLIVTDANGKESVNLAMGRLMRIHPGFPIWEDMAVSIDKMRDLLHQAVQMEQHVSLTGISEEILTEFKSVFDLANAEEVYPESIPQTDDPHKVTEPREELSLDIVRLKALQREIELLFAVAPHQKPTMHTLSYAFNDIWNMYHSSH